jgi:predicted transcriptional regulator
MTLRLAEEQDKQLTEIADALGISKQQAVERAISQMIAQNTQVNRAMKVLDEILVRDAKLLERLADA